MIIIVAILSTKSVQNFKMKRPRRNRNFRKKKQNRKYKNNRPNIPVEDTFKFPPLENIDSERPEIEPNVVFGPYKSVDDYLKIQYDLFLEDFMRPLREGIQKYKNKMMSDVQNAFAEKYDGIYIHRSVFIKENGNSYCCVIHSNGFRQINWNASSTNLLFFLCKY